jgi:hypothetical protein
MRMLYPEIVAGLIAMLRFVMLGKYRGNAGVGPKQPFENYHYSLEIRSHFRLRGMFLA